VSLDDWVLALHVLSAFALVGALVVFWVVVVGQRAAPGSEALTSLGRVGTVAVGIGSLGTLVFGIWLALSVGGYELWNGWIVAAFVLWLVGVGAGQRGERAFAAGENQRGVLLQAISSIAILLILVDMIWKPGA
jgi:hypothetical protein